MSTPVVIKTAAIQYSSNTTECHCTITSDTIVGTSEFTKVVVLNSSLLPVDWTDEDLCTAVSEQLNIPVENISVDIPLV